MRRLVFVAALIAPAIGCGSWKRVGSDEQPRPTETLTRLLNTAEFYKQLGRLAAAEPMPFVGTVAFAAGPADSVIAVLGLSLENRAFAFQREGNSFVARYRVAISFAKQGAPPVELAREEVVRVATFQETQRADESVLFQQVRVHGTQVRQRHLLGADPDLSGDGAGKAHRAALPGTQPARRGGLWQ
jgi:hypothetical protein